MNRAALVLVAIILGAISGAILGAVSGSLHRMGESTILLILAIPFGLVSILLLARVGHLNYNTGLLAFWALLIAHRAFVARVDSVDIQGFSMSDLLGEIGVTLLIFVGATLFLIRRLTKEKRLTISGAKLGLVGYVVFASVSTLWTPSLLYAGFWLLRLIAAAIILVLYFENVDKRGIERFMVATLLGSLPVIAAPILYFLQGNPIYSDRVIAGWLLPGTISIAAAAVGVYCLLKLMQTPSLSWLALSVLAFLSLFLAGGKAGAIAVPCSLLLVLVISTRLRLASRIVVVFAFIGILLLSNWNSLAEMDLGLISHTQNYLDKVNFGTLYIRFDLWNGALHEWLSTPLTFLFGQGYTATRVSGVSALSGSWTTSHAHNSILEALLELGLLGALPLLFFVLRPMICSLGQARHPSNTPLIPLLGGLFVLLMGSLTDDVFGGLLHPCFYLIIAFVISIDALLPRTTKPKEGYALSFAQDVKST